MVNNIVTTQLTWSFRLTDVAKLFHALAVLRTEQAQYVLPILLDVVIGLKGILSSGITELGTEILVCAWVVPGKSGKNMIHVWIGTILCLC